MGSLPGPVIFSAIHAKQAGKCKGPPCAAVVKTCKVSGGGFCGNKLIDKVNMSHHSQSRKNKVVRCILYSSSNESNGMAGNFKEGDACYVNATVVDAEVRSSSDGFTVMTRDGKHLRCVRNNPQSKNQPDYSQNPAVVLKVEDGTDLLLPIIVSEIPSVPLVAAMRDHQIATPSMYEVVEEMIEKRGCTVKLVRVTERAYGSYFAQLYLTKVDDIAEEISFDLQLSDAIDIALRCKVPIQVNRNLAYSDGLRVVESAMPPSQRFTSDDCFSEELDRPTDEPCVDAKEFILLRNMLVAAVEERYHDAAQWRDKLNRLRSTWLWMWV